MSIGTIILLAALITISCMFMAAHFEKKDFNNGICKKCGEKLRFFDYDSQGGRGYCCDKCGHVVWVSYNVDKELRGK